MDMQLSQCFFQEFLDGQAVAGIHPMLQVLETRQQKSTSVIMGMEYQSPGAQHQNYQMRARLNDGVYSYAGCIVPVTLCKRFVDDGLCNHNGVIKVTSWNSVACGEKLVFQILDYVLQSLEFPVIGNPIPHSGLPEKHRAEYSQIMKKIATQTGVVSAAENVTSWRSTQYLVKEEPENAMITSSSLKRRSELSPDQREPLRKKSSGGGGLMDTARAFITPIDVITPYINKYRICGMVSEKDATIKELSNARGTFRVFGFVVTDSSGNSIRVSAFGEQADKFFGLIKNDESYYISGSGGMRTVKAANKRFNSTNHDYEITLDRESEVTYCTDQFVKPPLKLKPVSLKNIPNYVNQHVDVQAIVDRVDEITQVTSRKDQRQLAKRDIHLVDSSSTVVCFTLWGEQAESFTIEPGTVLGIKGAVVREFNSGFSLSTFFEHTQLLVNLKGHLSEQLYLWYREFKPSADIKSLSLGSSSSESFARDFALIGVIMRDGVDQNNVKGAFYNVKAMITSVNTEQVIYQACPQQGCKKKVSVEGTNQYRCEKCDAVFDHCKAILMMRVEIGDLSGSVRVTIFDEQAEKLLGVKADEMMQWQKEDDHRFKAVLEALKWSEFLFRVRVQSVVFNDKQQLQWTVFDIRKVPVEKCKALYEKTLQKFEKL